MRLGRTISTAFLIMLLAMPLAVPSVAYADTEDELQEAQAALDEMNDEMSGIIDRIEQADARMDELDSQIEEMNSQADDLQEQLDESRRELGAIVVDAYKSSSEVTVLTILANSDSVDSLISDLYYVHKQSADKMSAINDTNDLRNKLDEQRKDVQDAISEQEEARGELEEAQEELSERQQSQSEYVSSLADEVAENIYALQNKEKETQRAVGEAAVSAAGGASGTKKKAIDAALSKIGATYVYGSGGPNTFDCSGLVSWAYGQAGVGIAHSSNSLKSYVQSIGNWVSVDGLQPGDLVLYSHDGGRTTYHVALYLGDGKVVHANGTKVVVSSLDYDKGAIGGGSPI